MRTQAGVDEDVNAHVSARWYPLSSLKPESGLVLRQAQDEAFMVSLSNHEGWSSHVHLLRFPELVTNLEGRAVLDEDRAFPVRHSGRICPMPVPAFSLHGKRALVTGGASGIGAATADVLAGLGARVALADIDDAGLAAVAATIGDCPDRKSTRLNSSH